MWHVSVDAVDLIDRVDAVVVLRLGAGSFPGVTRHVVTPRPT
jgi:hypothetical protein